MGKQKSLVSVCTQMVLTNRMRINYQIKDMNKSNGLHVEIRFGQS